jgi:hypothetical protein
MVNEDSRAVFLECEECMTIYVRVSEGGAPIEAGWSNDMESSTRFASDVEINAWGWMALVGRELSDGYSGDASAITA